MGMKLKFFIPVLIVVACNNSEPKNGPAIVDTLKTIPDTTQVVIDSQPEPVRPVAQTYDNKRFKDVRVEKIGRNKFRVYGQGQIFEANFGWVVEDGHEELKKGFQMTDAGAPEWGNFDFTIEVEKKRKNSTLTLILFETSAMDGSRQYELPVTLQ
jgi:hypothetical protein